MKTVAYYSNNETVKQLGSRELLVGTG